MSTSTASGTRADELSPAVLVERHEHVMLVTINRPDVRNAVNLAVTLGLGEALEEADRDRDIWALILTGAGEKAFCAGADLKAVARGEKVTTDDPVAASWGFAGYVSHHISKPTIAAVNGFALGGGTELSLASDLVVAAESASFGLPEVKRGIFAGAGGVFRLPVQIPRKIAMEMILTGDPISATKAHELGLVNQVVPQPRLLDAAFDMARRICVNAPLAVQASKRLALGVRDASLPEEERFWQLVDEEVQKLSGSEDAKEGTRAFAEKRTPQWKAR